MALKTIEYTAGLDGIYPRVALGGGVQGDHNATALQFTLTDGLYEKLNSQAVNGGNTVYYRIDRINGEGDYEPTVEQKLESRVIIYPLDEWITRYGGTVKATLVISTEGEGETKMELYHFTAVLSLKSRPTLSQSGGEKYRSMSFMSAAAQSAAESASSFATQAAESEKAAQAAAEECKAHAEGFNGAEVVFQSDLENESAPLSFDLVIDGFLSENSSNPVQNKVIKQALDELITNVNEKFDKVKAEAFLSAHPVGSYYWSSNATGPATLFGGTWERIKDRFILAAGDEYEVGANGGVRENKLVTEQLPKSFYFGTEYDNPGSPVQRYPIDSSIVNKASDYYTFVGKAQGTALEGQTKADTTGLKWIKGEAEGIDNMPPYETAYCWKRIA